MSKSLTHFPVREFVFYRLKLMQVSREEAAKQCGRSLAGLYRILSEPQRLTMHDLSTLSRLGGIDPMALFTASVSANKRSLEAMNA